MRGGLLACLVVALMSPLAQAARNDSPVVTEVRIENRGPGAVDKSFVLSHTSHRRNEPFNRTAIVSDVRSLLESGRFSEVSVDVETNDEGVEIIYVIANKHRLADLVINGLEHFRLTKARNILGLERGDFIDDQSIAVSARKLVAEYRTRFFPDARVTWELQEVDHAAGTADVIVNVAAGTRARVETVVFEGNEGIPDKTLKQLYRRFAWWNPFSWFRKLRYDPDTLDQIRNEIRRVYLERGNLDVRVDPPRLERMETGNVAVHFLVDEGVPYRFGDLSISGSGAELFPESVLLDLLKAEMGETASSSRIRGSRSSLRDYFGSRGYVETVVRPVYNTRPDDGLVDIVFKISEGDLVRISDILIRGNTRTRDKVIRRELLVYPGEIFNEVKVRQSERIINNLGFFSSVRSDAVSTRVPDERDLVFSVEEKRTGQFMVGAGFSSVDQIIGFMEVSQGNFDLANWPHFTGAGQKLRLRAQLGSRRDEYQISFTEPWFLDRKLSFSVSLFRTDSSYSDFDVERTGGTISLAKPLPGPNRIRFQYTLEQSVINDIADTNTYAYIDPPNDEFLFTDREDRIKSAMQVQVTHDTRNNPFIPTRGTRVVMSGEVAGGPFGFDTDLYELSFQGVHYIPLWWRHVFSLRTRWEVVEEYSGSDDVELSDRLYLGGGRTLRGFDWRDVGPKVVRVDEPEGIDTHRTVGGKSLAMAGAEYTIPLFSGVRLGTFFDIGNVWRDAFEFEFGTLASSGGLGLRFDMPGFPIRIDRAWVIDKDNDLTDEDSWVIWIGHE